MTLAFRDAIPADRVFVISSWLDSYRDSDTAGMIAMSDWYAVMWPQVEKVIDRFGARTIVAHDTDEHLYGFISADATTKPPLVFYCYVKAPYRRWEPKRGYARQLFAAIGIDPAKPFDYSYKTREIGRLANKIPLASWQPMLTRFPPGKGIRR